MFASPVTPSFSLNISLFREDSLSYYIVYHAEFTNRITKKPTKIKQYRAD